MWYSWPTSVVQSRSLFKHCELPLWNRYNSGGLPLLGQGQSMFGDPLHFLVLLANGASGWWDLSYLLAKFLFAASLGFCVLQLTKHLPAAVVIALSSSFLGFFAFRYSHPAFFSMCYAPLILLCWFKFMDATKGRRSALWLGLMVLANWMIINSGTVKEAYILLLGMNLCGCLTLLLSQSVMGKMAKLAQCSFCSAPFCHHRHADLADLLDGPPKFLDCLRCGRGVSASAEFVRGVVQRYFLPAVQYQRTTLQFRKLPDSRRRPLVLRWRKGKRSEQACAGIESPAWLLALLRSESFLRG